MWTKKDCLDEAARGEGCLGKARDDEPVFTVVGDDATMPAVLRFWAAEVQRLRGGLQTHKTEEALKFADEVSEWQIANEGHVKIPD